jgi:hypothetical protein
MKRISTVITVLAIGLLAASCGGGGNISKVKNGVFSGYDNSITVGKALENNSTLKGSKWESKEIGGHQYVAYTVTITGARLQQLLSAGIENGWRVGEAEEVAHPAYMLGKLFCSKLQGWQRLSAEKLVESTSISEDDVEQAYTIFKDIFEDQHNALPKDVWAAFDEDPFVRITFTPCFADKYYGPWFLASRDATNQNYGYISSTNLMVEYSEMVRGAVENGETAIRVKDGMLTGQALERFTDFLDMFQNPNAETLNREIAASILQFDTDLKKAEERLQSSRDDYYNGLENNSKMTIDSYEVIISFLMNQDGTFIPNMAEVYTGVTLNCYNNLKVRFNTYNTSNKEHILDYIYKDEDFSPDRFFQRVMW